MKRILGSGMGLGFLPFAPGTWASAAMAVLFIAVWRFLPWTGGGFARWLLPCAAGLLLTVMSVVLGSKIEDPAVGDAAKDPRWFVLDELAGQAVALAGIGGPDVLAQVLISFVFFRAFDIIKPWPLRKLEALPGGWGITADDLAAGILTFAARLVVVYAWVFVRG